MLDLFPPPPPRHSVPVLQKHPKSPKALGLPSILRDSPGRSVGCLQVWEEGARADSGPGGPLSACRVRMNLRLPRRLDREGLPDSLHPQATPSRGSGSLPPHSSVAPSSQSPLLQEDVSDSLIWGPAIAPWCPTPCSLPTLCPEWVPLAAFVTRGHQQLDSPPYPWRSSHTGFSCVALESVERQGVALQLLLEQCSLAEL